LAKLCREKRIAAGLCYSCGKNTPEAGRKLCRACLDRCAKKYISKKKDGHCGKCGEPNPDKNHEFCPTCLEKERRKRLDFLSAGFCGDCGRTPVFGGTTRCQKCSEDRKKYARIKKEKGLCIKCGEKPATMGLTDCSECRKKYKEKRDKKRGLFCACCGKPWTGLKTLCPECNEQKRLQRLAVKLKVIEAYGGKCACCGEDEPRHLSIDHINNDGYIHRREVGSRIYQWLIKNNYPKDNFQLLCFNCNFGKRINGGICPLLDPK
jgi:hypothetical protein